MVPSFVTSILTSFGVSALTTIALQTYLTKRIQHHFERQLEKYKADLEVQVHIRQELLGRRLKAYPELVELCYRTRNMARDLAQATGSLESLREYVARVRELEELVYLFRVDLEADQLFVLVHRYKKLMLEFYRTAADPLPAPDYAGAPTVHDRLAKCYLAIDDCYSEVVERLTHDTVKGPRVE